LQDILLKKASDSAQQAHVTRFFSERADVAQVVNQKAAMALDDTTEISFLDVGTTQEVAAIRFADVLDIEGLKTEAFQLHKKRSRKLRDAAFRAASGVCCVCDRNFSKVLGGRGVRVLQVHHREQLSAREIPSVTRQSDLAVVCANCHLLLHLDSERALSIEELRTMLLADGFYDHI
jgi:predicted HNH restriction endonuclease